MVQGPHSSGNFDTEVIGYLNETCQFPYCDNFWSILTFFKYPKCPSPKITYVVCVQL